MAITKLPLISLILLSLLTLSSSHITFSSTVRRAADILSNSAYLSVSLTLQLISKTLTNIHHSPYLTIFCPSDSAFDSSGQPSLSLPESHFSPLALPFRYLKKLPRNSKIPTLSPDHSLVITSSPSDFNVSLNGVNLTHMPIYNDGLLVIYGINEFFNPGNRVSDSSFKTDQDTISTCGFSLNDSVSAFEEASEVLSSKRYSLMGSFLELRLLGFNDRRKIDELTVFAPSDGVMMDYVGNVGEYSSLLLRHTVPCKISWSDLVGLDDGDVLKTFFSIIMKKENASLSILSAHSC